MVMRRYDDGANLLVGQELDGGIWEYTEEGGRVALEKARSAFGALDVTDGSRKTCPAAGVLGELRI